MATEQDPFASIAEPAQDQGTDPFASIADKPNVLTAPKQGNAFQRAVDDLSTVRPGDLRGNSPLTNAAQIAGANVIGSTAGVAAHPVKALKSLMPETQPNGLPTAKGALEMVLGPAGAPVVNTIEGTYRTLKDKPLNEALPELVGQFLGGELTGEAGAAAGRGVGRALKDTGSAVAPVLTRTSDEMMANLIGANKRGALGPKVTFKQASDIGKTVNDAIKGGTSLREIAGQINDAKSTLTADTEKMLSAVPEDTTVEVAPLFSKNANKAIEGTLNEPSHKAIMKLMSEFETQYPNQIGVQDALTLRRDLLRETDAAGTRKWPAGTKSYRTELYHDLNRELESTLPPDQAKIFRENNRKVTNLIKADRALDKKRLYGVGDLGKVHSTIGAAARVATGGTPGRMAAIKGLKLAGDKLGSTPTVTPATPKLYGVAGALTPNQQKDQQ